MHERHHRERLNEKTTAWTVSHATNRICDASISPAGSRAYRNLKLRIRRADMDTVTGTVMAGVATVVIEHTDGAKVERLAGVDEAVLLAFGSRAAARAGKAAPQVKARKPKHMGGQMTSALRFAAIISSAIAVKLTSKA